MSDPKPSSGGADASNAGDVTENVADDIVSFLSDRRDEAPFEWAHERAGFDAGRRAFDYL